MTREQSGKLRLYIGAGTLGIMIVFITWIFGAGKLVENVQKIPAIEAKVNDHDKGIAVIQSQYNNIEKAMTRIERKLDR